MFRPHVHPAAKRAMKETKKKELKKKRDEKCVNPTKDGELMMPEKMREGSNLGKSRVKWRRW